MTLSAKRIFLGLALLSMLTILPRAQTWNDASRMATIQSLVDRHSLAIDHSPFANTGDKVFVNGHFYSDKPVMTALFGALVYFPLHLAGLQLDRGWNLAYYLITLIVVKGLWLAGLVAFYLALGFTPLNDKPRIWLTLALGVASLYFTWSSTYNNHAVAAALLSIGFYFILKGRFRPTDQKLHLALAGFFLALAGTTDVPNGAFYVGFLIYVVVDRRLRRDVAFYLCPLVVTVLPALYLNYRISGSLVPVGMVRAYFEFPGSIWLGANGQELSGMTINRWNVLIPYAFACLIGSKGFILYNPLLFLAIPYMVRECGPKRMFAKEALTIGLASTLIVSYYLLFTGNYSGWSYSIRWFVPLLPLLFFFIHPFLAELTVRRKTIFASLFAVSAAIAVIGLFNPWSVGTLSKYPLVANFKLMARTFNAIAHQ
jgi:hypothetical protein